MKKLIALFILISSTSSFSATNCGQIDIAVHTNSCGTYGVDISTNTLCLQDGVKWKKLMSIVDYRWNRDGRGGSLELQEQTLFGKNSGVFYFDSRAVNYNLIENDHENCQSPVDDLEFF